jgi:hypothetical protein
VSVGNGGNKVRGTGIWKISEEGMTLAHQMSGVMGACSGMIGVVHAQRVCL